MHETSLFKTFSRVIWKHHSWIQATVFGTYDRLYPRYVRGMVKLIEVLWLMGAEFVVVILLLEQDYGCDKFANRRECEKRAHPVDHTLPMCTWDPKYYPRCTEFEPSPTDS